MQTVLKRSDKGHAAFDGILLVHWQRRSTTLWAQKNWIITKIWKKKLNGNNFRGCKKVPTEHMHIQNQVNCYCKSVCSPITSLDSLRKIMSRELEEGLLFYTVSIISWYYISWKQKQACHYRGCNWWKDSGMLQMLLLGVYRPSKSIISSPHLLIGCIWLG